MLSKFQNASLYFHSGVFVTTCISRILTLCLTSVAYDGKNGAQRGGERVSEEGWLHLPLQKLTYINVLRLQSLRFWAWILLNQRWTRTAAYVSSLLRFHLEKHRNERHLFNMSLPPSSKSPTERKLTETLALAEDQCRGRVVGRHFKQTRPSPEVQKAKQEEGRLCCNCTKWEK